jgi:hypothetical protein
MDLKTQNLILKTVLSKAKKNHTKNIETKQQNQDDSEANDILNKLS